MRAVSRGALASVCWHCSMQSGCTAVLMIVSNEKNIWNNKNKSYNVLSLSKSNKFIKHSYCVFVSHSCDIIDYCLCIYIFFF